jgi:rhamnosyltransferase
MNGNVAVDLSRVAVILPTWNSERYFDLFPGPLLQQGIRPDQVLIVDSESKDRTVERARSCGFTVLEIPRHEFNHGGTRALASTMVPWAEILVYTTPDAIMASPETVTTLVRVFDDPQIGAAYGRQLPHTDADPFARHACAFNYPEKSLVRDYETRKVLGFKTIFLSDNLGAYRRTALEEVGNFPQSVISLEDTYIAAKMMLHGWKTAYVAEAAVYHSHNQTLIQLFRRYFDTGVLHERESWLRASYGEPSGEGMRFVRSEIAWVRKENIFLMPKVFLRTAAKYLGYRMGRREAMFSNKLKRHLGNLHEYWTDQPRAISSPESR